MAVPTAADPLYPLFTVFAFFGFSLPLIPLTWHVQAWNAGTCYYAIWASLTALNNFVNSIVWKNTALNLAPAWCEISIRISFGASVAIPASSLCIIRRLYLISSAKCALTRIQKRRALVFDTLICVVFPLVYIALLYVVQGHRFDIYEEIGCYFFIYTTIPSLFILNVPSLIIALISATYGVRCLIALYRHHLELQSILSPNTSSPSESAKTTFTSDRLIPVAAITIFEMLLTTPLALFSLISNLVGADIQPYISWDNVHYNYSRVGLFPSVIWRADPILLRALEVNRWVSVSCGIIFFLFFGFTKEARRHYRSYWKAALGFPSTLVRKCSRKEDTSVRGDLEAGAGYCSKTDSTSQVDHVLRVSHCIHEAQTTTRNGTSNIVDDQFVIDISAESKYPQARSVPVL